MRSTDRRSQATQGLGQKLDYWFTQSCPETQNLLGNEAAQLEIGQLQLFSVCCHRLAWGSTGPFDCFLIHNNDKIDDLYEHWLRIFHCFMMKLLVYLSCRSKYLRLPGASHPEASLATSSHFANQSSIWQAATRHPEQVHQASLRSLVDKEWNIVIVFFGSLISKSYTLSPDGKLLHVKNMTKLQNCSVRFFLRLFPLSSSDLGPFAPLPFTALPFDVPLAPLLTPLDPWSWSPWSIEDPGRTFGWIDLGPLVLLWSRPWVNSVLPISLAACRFKMIILLHGAHVNTHTYIYIFMF